MTAADRMKAPLSSTARLAVLDAGRATALSRAYMLRCLTFHLTVIRSNTTRVPTIAVNMLAMMPSESVTANPLMGPVPNHRRTAAAIRVVTLASMMVMNARSYPSRIAARMVFLFLSSSRILSKIDRHSDGQNDACKSGERQRRLRADWKAGHERDDQKNIAPQRADRDSARRPVVDEHEEDDENAAYQHRAHARCDGIASERRTDGSFLDDRHRRRELACPEEDHQITGFLVREIARDGRRRARRNPRLDDGSLLHDPVEHEREVLADVGTGVRREDAAALTRQPELDARRVGDPVIRASVSMT